MSSERQPPYQDDAAIVAAWQAFEKLLLDSSVAAAERAIRRIGPAAMAERLNQMTEFVDVIQAVGAEVTYDGLASTVDRHDRCLCGRPITPDMQMCDPCLVAAITNGEIG